MTVQHATAGLESFDLRYDENGEANQRYGAIEVSTTLDPREARVSSTLSALVKEVSGFLKVQPVTAEIRRESGKVVIQFAPISANADSSPGPTAGIEKLSRALSTALDAYAFGNMSTNVEAIVDAARLDEGFVVRLRPRTIL